jgi:RNA polymerase sigma-54 factor
MEASMDAVQEMRQWISPNLIEANYILSLSRQELDQIINQELVANPALEVDTETTCPVCGAVMDGAFCAVCMVSHTLDRERESYEDYPEQLYTTPMTRDDSDDFDPMSLVGSSVNLRDQIALDVATLLHSRLQPVAEYLLDSIDERGFVDADLEDVAERFEVSLEEVEMALLAIQAVAPVGVGARNLRECLMLQVEHLRSRDAEVPDCVAIIVDRYLNELGAHKFGAIARELGVTAEEVEAAREYVRANLTPFPMQNAEARQWRSPVDSPYVAPDVIISIRDGELHVEVVETRHAHLKVNSLYEQLARAALARRMSGMDDEARGHVREHVARARLFLGNVRQRHETLARISRCVADLQEDFLRGGVRNLRPLTRATVAQQVGVHESTVSRATANKFVMLPNRKVIPFSDFFTPSLSVKDMIREIVEEENQSLTDKRIVELLRRRGVRIARRTVAKYRYELNILPSTLR